MTGRLASVNLGVRPITTYADGPGGQTGIDKRPAGGRVRVTAAGVDGDYIGNRRVHGDTDKAAYAYAREDAAWWSAQLGREVGRGAFGENLSTEGLDVTGAVIGERWAIGSAVFEVATPRTPCTTFAGFWDVPDLIKRFTAHGAPGAYLRVVQDGDVGAGDEIEVVARPGHGVTLGETFRALNGEPVLLPRLLQARELPEGVRAKVQRRVAATTLATASQPVDLVVSARLLCPDEPFAGAETTRSRGRGQRSQGMARSSTPRSLSSLRRGISSSTYPFQSMPQ
jgi:MOSC domain-containing protein YiiM